MKAMPLGLVVNAAGSAAFAMIYAAQGAYWTLGMAVYLGITAFHWIIPPPP